MTDYEDEDDDNDLGSDLVRRLRKANKQKDRELTELKTNFDNLNRIQRERTIKDTLESRGISSKLASLIPNDIGSTEESVFDWLEEYKDIFKDLSLQANQRINVDPEQAAAYQRMTSTSESGFIANNSDDTMYRLVNANSQEEVLNIMKNSKF